MNTLQFIYTPEIWPDSEPTKHWFSGRYKITHYPRIEGRDTIIKECYHAYYKPDGWKNWGMGCVAGNPPYSTLEQAQAACQSHATVGDYTSRGTCRKVD